MKKNIFLSLALAVVFIFGGLSMASATTSTESADASDLAVTARGYILLQVEKRGEAWYVNPENSFRYYMKDGETAYNIMREMGLGISNSNLAKLKAGQKSLINRLKGRIVLQVEENGEAYYVNPGTGTLHYLKDGNAAYSVMRNLSLGITDENISKIPDSDLKTYKAKKTVDKTISESNNPDGSIVLSGKVVDGQVNLSWSLSDLVSSKGFKVVVANHENPVYPGDKYHYLSDADVRADSWDELSAGTYYFRVCEYLGGKCGVYSNNLKLVITKSESESDSEQDSESVSEAESEDEADSQGTISLTGQVIDGRAKLSWILKDMKSPLGFKVVVDNHENPVYPGNEYHYLSNANVRSDSWDDLSAGTYYFRVCEYLGGKCGVYSNNLKLSY